MPKSRKTNLSRRAMMRGVLATADGLALSQSESWLPPSNGPPRPRFLVSRPRLSTFRRLVHRHIRLTSPCKPLSGKLRAIGSLSRRAMGNSSALWRAVFLAASLPSGA
jgi:hypothetical protein